MYEYIIWEFQDQVYIRRYFLLLHLASFATGFLFPRVNPGLVSKSHHTDHLELLINTASHS